MNYGNVKLTNELIMRSFISYALLLSGMILFSACSSDDDETTSSHKTASSPFVGYWKCKMEKGTTNILFYDNGTLLWNGSEYRWNYNENTALLSTTANDYQWEVTLVDSTAWSAIALWGNKSSVTNYRAEAGVSAKQILTDRKWEYNDTVYSFTSNSDESLSKFKITYRSGDNTYFLYNRDGFNTTSTKEYIADNKIIIKSNFTDYDVGPWTGRITATMTGVCNMTIENPYSYDNVRVSCHLASRYTAADGTLLSTSTNDMLLKPRNRNLNK